MDNYLDSDELRIKLHNTKLGISTTWSLPKFQSQLEQMGVLYVEPPPRLTVRLSVCLFV